MDDPLERLIRELRREACPGPVLDQARRRIAREPLPPGPRRPVLVASLVGALAVVLLAAGPIWQSVARREVAVPGLTEERSDHARVVAQAQGALVVIGRILIETGSHAENALLDEAGPPLLKSFHTAKTKLTESL